MNEDRQVNLLNMLGQEKYDNFMKHMEDSKKRQEEDEKREKDRVERMTKAMIDKGYLISGEYYSGYRFRGKHVAMWDGKKGCFQTINFTMGQFYVEELPYFGDVIETNQDGFLPFDKIEARKI